MTVILRQGAPADGEQKAGGSHGQQPVMLASFGFGGVYAAERWGPITVSVTPGDKPLAGSIIVVLPTGIATDDSPSVTDALDMPKTGLGGSFGGSFFGGGS